MFNLSRRQALAAGGGLIGSLLVPQRFARAAVGSTLNIAYNVNLPSFDPQVGPSSVNPTIQGIYRSIFDQYVGQKPNLAFEPGLLTAWGWNDDKTKVWMDVREGVVWHDGTPFTPEDVVWSIQREAKPDGDHRGYGEDLPRVTAKRTDRALRRVSARHSRPPPHGRSERPMEGTYGLLITRLATMPDPKHMTSSASTLCAWRIT